MPHFGVNSRLALSDRKRPQQHADCRRGPWRPQRSQATNVAPVLEDHASTPQIPRQQLCPHHLLGRRREGDNAGGQDGSVMTHSHRTTRHLCGHM